MRSAPCTIKLAEGAIGELPEALPGGVVQAERLAPTRVVSGAWTCGVLLGYSCCLLLHALPGVVIGAAVGTHTRGECGC